MTDNTPRDENAIPTEQIPDAASNGAEGARTGSDPDAATRPMSADGVYAASPQASTAEATSSSPASIGDGPYAASPAAVAADEKPRRRVPKRVLLIVGTAAAALLVLGITFAGGFAAGSIGGDRGGRSNASDVGPGDGRGPGGIGPQDGDRTGPGAGDRNGGTGAGRGERNGGPGSDGDDPAAPSPTAPAPSAPAPTAPAPSAPADPTPTAPTPSPSDAG